MKKNIIVLFIWDVDKSLKNHLKRSLKDFLNVKLIFPKFTDEKNILKFGLEADIIIGWRLSIDLLRKLHNLKVFINPGTGIKHHIENFKKINKTKKVILVNGHGHAYSTAQHTIAMLLALMNRIIPHHNRMKEGIWRTSDDKDFSNASVQLKNRNIGLLGYGAINKYVHKFLSGFEKNNFHVLRHEWKNKNEKYPTFIKKYEGPELHKFLECIDLLIIAIPHTSKTDKMIGEKELALLEKNTIIVNVARGSIIDEKSLYELLKKNKIAGAAIDVWYNYNPVKDKNGKEYPYKSPFYKLENVVMSPHRAASPFDDLGRWDEVIENITRVANGRKDLMNIVNLKKEY